MRITIDNGKSPLGCCDCWWFQISHESSDLTYVVGAGSQRSQLVHLHRFTSLTSHQVISWLYVQLSYKLW